MNRWHGGTQPERTALAWTRTTLALAGAGLLFVRLAPSSAGAALGAAIVCGTTVLLLRRVHVPERGDAHPSDGYRPDPAAVLLATTVTVLVGVVGLLFAFD